MLSVWRRSVQSKGGNSTLPVEEKPPAQTSMVGFIYKHGAGETMERFGPGRRDPKAKGRLLHDHTV